MKKERHIYRINTKGPLSGPCNICGEVGPLTEDHTPPKGCGRISQMEARRLSDTLSAAGASVSQPRRFQAGIYYRSICTRCNGLMGNDYDPVLAQLCAQVRSVANSSLLLRPMTRLTTKPQAVMRSILGHLMAQGINRYAKGPLTEPLRDYMLNQTASLPAPIRFYYWFYPYREQVLVRDAGRLEIAIKTSLVFWLMKFFPLAFFITFNEPNDRVYVLANLDEYGNEPFECVREIVLPIFPLVHAKWPEAPNDGSLILYGEQALSGMPRARIVRP